MARRLILVAALLVLGAIRETFAMHPGHLYFGSSPADLGEFPHQISLRIDNNHFCGGSLIGNQYVLTSARCVLGILAVSLIDVTVVTGTISLSGGGEHHKIKDAVKHPNYVSDSEYMFHNDIGIITLAAPITPNANQRPIRVASYDPPKNARLISTGWPRIADSMLTVPFNSKLQKKTVIVLSNPRCQLYTPEVPIFDTELCTAGQESYAVGDLGGPLVYNSELVGILTGISAGTYAYPDTYARVSQYLDFINSTVEAQEFSIRSGYP